MSNLSELFMQRKEKAMNYFFGENNYKIGGKRFTINNNVLNNDEVIICTNNVSYWSNKDQYVLWVDNDKIVYLKPFQVKSVYNHEVIGNCYLVKLNRKYFKSYNCFTNEEMCFDKECTFDDLLEVAKSQTGNGLWFKNNKEY